MTGAAWAVCSGIGFGLFQTLNARAVRGVGNVYVSTGLQMLVAAALLGAVAAASEDLSSLAEAPAWALVACALAGLIHFFVGWTTLNLSQARIGAARTSPLLSTTPVFGLLLALAFTAEVPTVAVLGGIALIILGAYLVADSGAGRARLRDSGYALATAAAWACSSIFTVEAVDELHSPLLGVEIGLLAATAAYGVLLAVKRIPVRGVHASREALDLKLAAGVAVAFATWGRWIALESTDVGVVLALALVSIPVVLLLAPIVSGRHLESVSARTWLGAILVAAGSLFLIWLE